MSLIDRSGWTLSASSTNPSYPVTNAKDANLSTFWASVSGDFPHWISIDMGSAQQWDYLRFIPSSSAFPTTVEVYVSDDGADWGSAVATATWAADTKVKIIVLAGIENHRYVKLNATAGSAAYLRCVEIYLGLSEITDRNSWVAYATNSYTTYLPALMLDGSTATFWASSGGYPLAVWFDMGKAHYADTIKHTPRQDGWQDRFGAVTVEASDDGVTWGSALGSDTWANDASEKTITFTGISKRWFRLSCSAVAAGGRNFGSCAELTAEGTAPTTPLRSFGVIVGA